MISYGYFSIPFEKIISYVYTEIFVYCHELIINRYFTCYVDVFKFWKSYQTFFIGIYYSKNWIWCQNICRAITTSWVQRLGPSLPINCPFFKSINKIVPRSFITEGQNFLSTSLLGASRSYFFPSFLTLHEISLYFTLITQNLSLFPLPLSFPSKNFGID